MTNTQPEPWNPYPCTLGSTPQATPKKPRSEWAHGEGEDLDDLLSLPNQGGPRGGRPQRESGLARWTEGAVEVEAITEPGPPCDERLGSHGPV